MNKNVADYMNFQNKRAMIRVLHPPGGGSSLSLGWDPQPPVYKVQKYKQQKNSYLKHNSSYAEDRTHAYDCNNSQRLPNNSFINNASQLMNQQYNVINNKSYFQPSKQSYLSMQQSTRLLQEQLKFYQDKNKLLRQKIYGGYPIDEQLNKFMQYKPRHKVMSSYQQQDQLERGLNQRLMKQNINQNHKNSNWKINQNNSMFQQNSPRTSVKVHNPPGGRSSIKLG